MPRRPTIERAAADMDHRVTLVMETSIAVRRSPASSRPPRSTG